jgi:proteasome lid subunit RPN8/RPN11
MSDPDPQDSSEQTIAENAFPAADKKIVFGARKPTEEVCALTGIPLIIDAPFPHERTLQWLPLDWEEMGVETEIATPEEADLAPSPPESIEALENGNTNVVVSQEVLIKVNEHVSQTLDRELGGFLLGNRYRCTVTGCDYVIIDQYSPAKFTESSEVRLAFTHEAWAQISDELSGKFLGKLLIGWYHSHPYLDVFLSSHDMDIQTERFAEPWMVAMVLEPAKHHGGFFCSRGGRVNPHSPVEFFELLERNSRDSVIAWENYRALDPSTSSTPVLSTTNTATSTSNTSQELLEVRAKQAEVLPAKPRRRGRLFVFAAVFLVLAGATAFGVRNRLRIATWWQQVRTRSAQTETPQPSPSPEQSAPVQQPSEQPSAVPQSSIAAPEVSPVSSPSSTPTPTPTPSPTPSATRSAGPGSTRQPAATTQPARAALVEQPAKRPTRRTTAKRSGNTNSNTKP